MRTSIRFQLIVGLVLAMLPLLLVLLLYNVYAMNVVRDQVSLTNTNLLQKHVEEHDKLLTETNKYLYLYASRDPEISLLNETPFPSSDYTILKQRVVNRIQTDLLFYGGIDAFFIYNIKNKDWIIAGREGYDDKLETLERMLPEQLARTPESETGKWSLQPSGKRYAIVKMVRLQDQENNLLIGAWVDANTLVRPLQFFDMGPTGGAVLLSGSGVPVSDTPLSAGQLQGLAQQERTPNRSYGTMRDPGDRQKYLVVGIPSKMAELQYTAVIPESGILKNLPVFQRALYAFPIGIVIIIALYLLLLRQVLFRPMERLVQGMRRIMRGDLSVRLDEGQQGEFGFLFGTFNNMMGQIETLKIDVYEEQLRTQRAEFKHLQAQIRPHFFLNSLNIIHSLSASRNYGLIQQMTEHLAAFFRFSIRTNQDLIELGDELDHIRSYLEIQKLRFPGRLTYRYEVPEELRRLPVLPLTVQPFVENAVIHGFMDRSRLFEIVVTAGTEPETAGAAAGGTRAARLVLTVEDTGTGFPADALQRLQAEGPGPSAGGEHLGIGNVVHRLQLQHGAEAQVRFYNRTEGGAGIRISLPAGRPLRPYDELEDEEE